MINKNIKYPNQQYTTPSRWSVYASWLDFRRSSVDLELFMIILSLIFFGFIITFSGYFYFSWQQHTLKGISLLFFIGRQGLWLIIGFLAMIFTSVLAPRAIYRFTPIFFISVLILNLMPVLGFLGQEIRGGRRWLSIGVLSFQPSELAKLALILYLARVVQSQKDRLTTSFIGTIRPMIMVTLLGLTVYLQNDLSTSIFLFITAVTILFMGGVNIKYLAIQAVIILTMSIFAIMTSNFRMQRLILWLSGNGDLLGQGRQPTIALKAIRESGLIGSGLGSGRYKLGKISLVQSDYIFTTIVEELGLIGIISTIGLFSLLLIKAYNISRTTHDTYTSFLATTIAITLAGQAFLNMAVVIGIFPVTGLPLPFFSAGGSNLFVSMIMCGLLLNTSRTKLAT